MIRNKLIAREMTDVANRMPELTSSGWWDVNDIRTWPRAKLIAVQEARTAKQRMCRRRIFGHTETQTDARFWYRKKSIQWMIRGPVAAVSTEPNVQPQDWPTKTLLSIVELPVQTRGFSYSFLRDKKTWNRDRKVPISCSIVIQLNCNLQEKNVLHMLWRSCPPCSPFCISAVKGCHTLI